MKPYLRCLKYSLIWFLNVTRLPEMHILPLASTSKLEHVNFYSIPSVCLLLQLLNKQLTSHLQYKQTFKWEKKTVLNLQTDWNSINGPISWKVSSFPMVTMTKKA